MPLWLIKIALKVIGNPAWNRSCCIHVYTVSRISTEVQSDLSVCPFPYVGNLSICSKVQPEYVPKCRQYAIRERGTKTGVQSCYMMDWFQWVFIWDMEGKNRIKKKKKSIWNSCNINQVFFFSVIVKYSFLKLQNRELDFFFPRSVSLKTLLLITPCLKSPLSWTVKIFISYKHWRLKESVWL